MLTNSKKLTEAIYNHHIIKALTTNARSAFFTIEAMKPLFQAKESKINDIVLQNSAPHIVQVVANQYIRANGISYLNRMQRCIVACMVFEALTISSSSNEPYIPEFEGLDDIEKTVALSIIDTNVEIVSKIRKFANKQLPSLTVSPALAIILFSMFGISADLFSTWRAQEQNCAYYVFRQKVLKCAKDFRDNGQNLDRLGKELMELQMVKLNRRVPEPKASSNIYIPLFNTSTIWINGAMAPFADIVAPFCLYQCKHTEKFDVQIDWITEFDQCGLLKSSNTRRAKIGWIVTSTLMKIWQLESADTHIYDTDLSPETKNNHLDRDLYRHRFHSQVPVEPHQYIHVVNRTKDDDDKWFFILGDKSEEEFVVPTELSKDIEFIFYCNTPTITIVDGATKMSISEEQLNIDGTIKEKNPSWPYFRDQVNGKVKIRFFLG